MDLVASVGVSVTVVAAFVLCAVYYRVLNALFNTFFSSKTSEPFQRTALGDSAVISYDTRVDGTPKKLYVSYNSRKNLCLRQFSQVEVFDDKGKLVAVDTDVVAYSLISPYELGMYMIRFVHEDEEDANIVLVGAQVLFYDFASNTVAPGLTVPVSCLPQQTAGDNDEQDSSSASVDEKVSAEDNENDTSDDDSEQDDDEDNITDNNASQAQNTNTTVPLLFTFAEAMRVQNDEPVIPSPRPYTPPASCDSVNLLTNSGDDYDIPVANIDVAREPSTVPVEELALTSNDNDKYSSVCSDIENPEVLIRKRIATVSINACSAESDCDDSLTALKVVTVASD